MSFSFTRLLGHTHNDTPLSVGLLWTNDQPVAETSTFQHTTLTTHKYPFAQRDSNPRSQQSCERRPKLYIFLHIISYLLIRVLRISSPSHLYSEHRVSFAGVKRPERGLNHPHLGPSYTSTPPLDLNGLLYGEVNPFYFKFSTFSRNISYLR